MSLAWRELVRRPGRFAVAGSALTLLVVLLFLLGGLLDGLFLGSTGAIRSLDGDAVVYSDDSRSSVLRSRIDPDVRAAVEGVDGVDAVGGLGVALLGATHDGDLLDAAVLGYELAPEGVPDPPPPGEAWADRRLGVEEGDVLRLGPAEVELTVAGLVDDTSYLLQGALWVEAGTWREGLRSSRPDAALGDDVFQALVVQGDATPDAIDGATGGATATLTKDEAVLSLPGTKQQNSTFTALIGVTLFVSGLVTALFFALLTLERASLYATLKALGARSGRLVGGVVLQAVAVAAGALVVGGVLALLLAAVVPEGVTVQLEPRRIATSALLVVVTAALGAAVSLRRIVRIDPATAIG